MFVCVCLGFFFSREWWKNSVDWWTRVILKNARRFLDTFVCPMLGLFVRFLNFPCSALYFFFILLFTNQSLISAAYDVFRLKSSFQIWLWLRWKSKKKKRNFKSFVKILRIFQMITPFAITCRLIIFCDHTVNHHIATHTCHVQSWRKQINFPFRRALNNKSFNI